MQLAPVDPHADATSIFCDVVFVTSNESVSTPVGSIGVWCETAGEDVCVTFSPLVARTHVSVSPSLSSHAERLPDPDSQTFFRANLLSIVRALEKAPFPKPSHPLLNKLCVKSKSEWLVEGASEIRSECDGKRALMLSVQGLRTFRTSSTRGSRLGQDMRRTWYVGLLVVLLAHSDVLLQPSQAMITYIRTLVQARSSHSQTVIFSLLSGTWCCLVQGMGGRADLDLVPPLGFLDLDGSY